MKHKNAIKTLQEFPPYESLTNSMKKKIVKDVLKLLEKFDEDDALENE